MSLTLAHTDLILTSSLQAPRLVEIVTVRASSMPFSRLFAGRSLSSTPPSLSGLNNAVKVSALRRQRRTELSEMPGPLEQDTSDFGERARSAIECKAHPSQRESTILLTGPTRCTREERRPARPGWSRFLERDSCYNCRNTCGCASD